MNKAILNKFEQGQTLLKLQTMFDVITFGSATCDIFLPLQKFGRESGKICFDLGDKIEAGDWLMYSGGGGTNTVCTFALQGFKTAYCGLVGRDYFGQKVLDDLEKSGVFLKMVKKHNDKPTALSVVLSPQEGDRVILASPGACHFLTKEEIDWDNAANSRWFYIAPFYPRVKDQQSDGFGETNRSCDEGIYNKSSELLSALVSFAKQNKIKIALNPSESQIKECPQELKKILAGVDVLLLNLNEAAILAGVSFFAEPKAIAKQIREQCSGIIVITMGKRGVCVLAGDDFYSADIFPIQVAERTGAGDAFGAGLVAGLLQKNNLEYAIRLAMANSAACLSQIGAKNGLLKKGELDGWPALNIKKG